MIPAQMNLAWLLVAALYALGAYAVRKRLPVHVALLFAALVFGFLWRPLTQAVTIVPTDVLRLLPPWSELRAPGRAAVTKYDVSNLNLHDLPMQVVPWMHQVRESWRAGRVPLWNEAAGCGYPLLANGQSTPFSPFVLLTLPLPLDYAIAAQAALKLLLALTLTFLFCRRRHSVLGSTLAALAYGFSTWMITWLQFPIATASALLPAVLMAIEDLLERRRFTLPVLTFVLTVLSGHPETVFNIGLIAAAYGLWLTRSVRGLLRVLAASVVAACICAPFLVPFAEAVTRSQRFAEIGSWTGVPFSDRASATLLLQPRFFGHLPIERPWGPTTLESICGFAGVLSIACAIAAAILVIRKRHWRSPEMLFVLGAIVSLGIVLGWPGLTQLFDAIAGFAPAMRMRLGLCWFASILIAFVVDERESRVPLLLGALGVALLMLFFMRTTPFPTQSHRASALLSLLPGMAVLLALLHRRLIVVAGALTVVELWLTMAHWNPVLPLRNLETPLIAKLKTLDGRIVGLGGQMYPNVGAFWGIEDVRVHDPMAYDPYVTYLERNAGWNRADYYAKWTDPDSPLLDRLNVRHIVSDRELPGRSLVYAGRDGFIYANPTARGRFFSDNAEVTVEGSRVRVKAAQHALVKSSVVNYPGWRASVPLFPADGPFLAFMVPPGEHVIEVEYRPRSFTLSLIVAAIATAALLVRMRRRRAPR